MVVNLLVAAEFLQDATVAPFAAAGHVLAYWPGVP